MRVDIRGDQEACPCLAGVACKQWRLDADPPGWSAEMTACRRTWGEDHRLPTEEEGSLRDGGLQEQVGFEMCSDPDAVQTCVSSSKGALSRSKSHQSHLSTNFPLIKSERSSLNANLH